MASTWNKVAIERGRIMVEEVGCAGRELHVLFELMGKFEVGDRSHGDVGPEVLDAACWIVGVAVRSDSAVASNRGADPNWTGVDR